MTTDAEVDARWLMAFAAGLGDTSPAYLDTRRTRGIVGHPVFPVCVEWPGMAALRARPEMTGVTRDEASRGVHAAHDLTIHRLVHAGDRLHTTATVAGIVRRPSGAVYTTIHETVDAEGAPVATTRMTSVFLGVDVAGDDRPPPEPPGSAITLHDRWEPEWVREQPIRDGAAHVYTECARIWNPIHTDASVAAAAGLPGIILHGTATLAHAVSAVLDEYAGNDPERVRRVRTRFRGMVLLPNRLSIELTGVQPEREAPAVGFRVRTSDGTVALDNGLVELTPAGE